METSLSHWRDHAVPPMCDEALYGDRIVRCFAERPSGLAAMFARSCASRPDAAAIAAESVRWRYAQADAEAARIAAGLSALGVGARDRVVPLLGNRPEFLSVLLAVRRLGAIAVPFGIREQRPGIAYVAGSVDADGFVRIVDRKKDMPNRGGHRVHSVKVENVLLSMPGVVEAAVIGVPCPVLARPRGRSRARSRAKQMLSGCATTAPSGSPTTRCRNAWSGAHCRCRATPTAR